MKFDHVYLVGTGGSGSHLAKVLAMLLANKPEGKRPTLTLIDADTVEPGNLSRQAFATNNINEFKVNALVNAIKPTLPDGFKLYGVNKWFTPELAAKAVKENSLIIGCVDNHRTNKQMEDAVGNLQTGAFICSTGHLTEGMIFTHIRYQGRELSAKPSAFRPEIADPKDYHPGEDPDCFATANEGGLQLIATNTSSAMHVLQVVSALLDGDPIPTMYHFDILKFKAMSQLKLLDVATVIQRIDTPATV